MLLRAGFGAVALLSVASVPGALVWELSNASLSTAIGARHDTEQAMSNDPPIPIVAATADSQDVPIYIFALGTVQPLNTVTVRSRVDGELLSLRFQEGQD